MSTEPELLERDIERGAVERALQDAGGSSGTLLLVQGDAGVGKSALLDVARAEATQLGLIVAAVAGDELGREYAFGAALRLFEPLVRDVDGNLRAELFDGPAAAARPLFERGPGDQGGGPGDLFPVIHGLAWLVANLAEASPLLIVVDDLQWIDEPSLRFLAYLADRLQDLSIALLAAIRPGERCAPDALLDELRARALTNLELRPLSEGAVLALVGERIPGAQPDFARECFEATGGNPFLLDQLLAEVAARGEEAGASTTPASELVPGGVLKAVTARLWRLVPEAALLALAVAILGDATLDEAATLAEIGTDQAGAAVDALVAAALVQFTPRLSFVHPLVRSSIYATMSESQRGLKHLTAARMVEARGAEPERVAAHLLVAHRGADPWVVDRLREAARSARAAGAPASAAAYLQRALEEPVAPADRARVLLELGRAEAASGREGAVDHLEAAVELTPPGSARAEVLGELGQVLYAGGRFPEAAAAFDRGLAEAPPQEEELRVRLEAGWVTVARLDAGLRPEAVARMQPLLDRPSTGATHAERVLLANVANQVVFTAEPRAKALDLARRALGDGELLREETAAGMTWVLAAGSIGWADELDEFYEISQAGMEDARRHGSVIGFAQASYARSFSSYYRGQLDDALADLELALDARRYGWEQFIAAAVAQYAWALVDRDDVSAAERALASEIADPRWESSPMLGLLLEARARVRLAQGRPREALDDARAGGRRMLDALLPNPALIPWRSRAATAAAQLGEAELARDLAEEEVGLARRFGAPRVTGMALRGHGLSTGGPEGIESLREAVSVLETSPARLELARAVIDLGSMLRRNRQPVEAREPLKRGLDMAHRFGARALERQAQQELSAAGARPRRWAMSGRAGLTPAELRVAEMAVAGLSNRDIAQALFLTARTVETHLTHAYRKLEIKSRSGLADALSR